MYAVMFRRLLFGEELSLNRKLDNAVSRHTVAVTKNFGPYLEKISRVVLVILLRETMQ